MKMDQPQQIMELLSEAPQQDKEETARAIFEMIEEAGGNVPFVIRMLSKRPDVSVATLIKFSSLLKNKEILDEKTSELIAISAAVANRCEFCISTHMNKAVSLGATEEEVFHTILISSAICESSAWAYAFREFRKLEGKEKRKRIKRRQNSKESKRVEHVNHKF